MARVTVEDCLEKVDNRFSLVHLAAQRVCQLRNGAPSHLIDNKNKLIVTALREIASGTIYEINNKKTKKEYTSTNKTRT